MFPTNGTIVHITRNKKLYHKEQKVISKVRCFVGEGRNEPSLMKTHPLFVKSFGKQVPNPHPTKRSDNIFRSSAAVERRCPLD